MRGGCRGSITPSPPIQGTLPKLTIPIKDPPGKPCGPKTTNLKKKVGAVKGKLKLCCIHPDLLEVFRITRLDQVFEIYAEEQAALDKF